MTEAGLVFYYRDGCHLCETLASILYRGWPHVLDDVQWADVDSRADWKDRYGLRVPVLEKNGLVICELTPDSARLQEHFGAPRNPV